MASPHSPSPAWKASPRCEAMPSEARAPTQSDTKKWLPCRGVGGEPYLAQAHRAGIRSPEFVLTAGHLALHLCVAELRSRGPVTSARRTQPNSTAEEQPYPSHSNRALLSDHGSMHATGPRRAVPAPGHQPGVCQQRLSSNTAEHLGLMSPQPGCSDIHQDAEGGYGFDVGGRNEGRPARGRNGRGQA